MTSVNFPATRYPIQLDDLSSLLLVRDRSESFLHDDVTMFDNVVTIVPDFDLPERWSEHGGYARIDDEDVYYESATLEYAPSTDVMNVGALFVSQVANANLGSMLMIDGHVPTPTTGLNSVCLRSTGYTLVGKISVGGQSIDVAVSGNGYHGSGSLFVTSRPDLVQAEFCHIDADAGTVFISTIDFGWTMIEMWWVAPLIDKDSSPLRRVSRFNKVSRGVRGTPASRHLSGAVMRGYIVAEHHEILADAITMIETFVGIDNSDDKSSLDFRLRDLNSLCVEEDDWGCPDATITFEELPPDVGQEDCAATKVVEVTANIVGTYERFSIFYGDGQSTSENLQSTHRYPASSRVEPYIVAGNSRCDVTTAFLQGDVQTVETLPDIPTLVCPDILLPDIPDIPDIQIPDFSPGDTNVVIYGPSISYPSISFPSIWISIPTQIDIPTPSISVYIPPFPTINVDFNPTPITVELSISIGLPPDSGPCFQLVPCVGYHHPGYH